MISSLSEFTKTLKTPSRNDDLLMESVDVFMNVMDKCLEHDERIFIRKKEDLGKLFVFLLMTLNCYDKDPYMREILQRITRFLDITKSVPRSYICSTVDPLSKIHKCLFQKFSLARTYITQEYIIKIWFQIFKEIGNTRDILDKIKFNKNEKCDNAIKKEFVAIKLDSFDRVSI
jgi:hypothetical protein